MSDNRLQITVPCPYCGQKCEVEAQMEKDLDYVWDEVAPCLHCGKLFVYVTHVVANAYTVNIPDAELPHALGRS